MRVDAEDQKLAEEMGVGIWFLAGVFFELYPDEDEIWHVNVTWGNYAGHDTSFYVLESLQKRGIKLDQRHFDAIERVNAPVETVQAESLQESPAAEDEAEAPSAVENIVAGLIAAREVSDEEMTMGFVTDTVTNDVYKVIVQYIGNRPNE